MTMPSPLKKNQVSKRSPDNERITPNELHEFMVTNGISEKELSQIFGVTPQAVRMWLTGTREFSVTNSRLINLFKRHPRLIREF